LVARDQSSGRSSTTKAGSGAVRAETDAVQHLSFAIGGHGLEGNEVGEEAQCTDVGERKMGGTRDGVGRCLFMAAWRRGRGGKGQGVWLGATWGQEERRGWGRGAVALGCSDSSRWHTSHRRGGRAVNRGGGGSERRGHIG
jgi:hypothetical protein